MAFSKKWASFISAIASSLYFFLIVFQIPLFRLPCRTRICKTPIEVMSSQLLGSELIPSFVVKTLLYPGAIGKAIISGNELPSYNKLLKYYGFDNVRRISFAADLHHLEVSAGSCLCVLGALLSVFKPRRMSFIGALLIFWGLLRDGTLMESSPGRTSEQGNTIQVHPMMFLAAVSAFLSIKSDIRKIVRSCRVKPVTKSL